MTPPNELRRSFDMNKKGKLILGGTVAGLIGAVAIAGAVQADSGRRGHGWGHHGGGYHMGMGGPGGRSGMMRHMADLADADKDGKVTQAEIDKARDDRFAKYDANGDGKLTLDEFENLMREITRPMTVRAFQRLDPNGDAVITVEELSVTTANIVERMDRNNDGALSLEDRGRRHWQGRDGDDDDDDRRPRRDRDGRGPGPRN
jgi:hypothetical protein